MTTLQKLMREINSLEPIPAVANQLLTIVDDPDSSMEDIANVIQYDPAMTATVLKACNGAYFGLKHPAESIKDAVNMLGTDQVIELVLLKAGARALGNSQRGYGLKSGDMWRYSVSSAVIAKQVAIQLSLENKNTIFTSALIKDIGKIILERYVSDSFVHIQHLVKNKNVSFIEAEKKILGIDHAEIGAMTAKMWKFSPRMVKIIQHHHLPDPTMIGDQDIAVVHLADCISMMLGIGVGVDGLSYRFKDQAMKTLGLGADDLAMIIAEFGIGIQEVEALIQVV